MNDKHCAQLSVSAKIAVIAFLFVLVLCSAYCYGRHKGQNYKVSTLSTLTKAQYAWTVYSGVLVPYILVTYCVVLSWTRGFDYIASRRPWIPVLAIIYVLYSLLFTFSYMRYA